MVRASPWRRRDRPDLILPGDPRTREQQVLRLVVWGFNNLTGVLAVYWRLLGVLPFFFINTRRVVVSGMGLTSVPLLRDVTPASDSAVSLRWFFKVDFDQVEEILFFYGLW